jgi:hypothetical protein
MKYDPFIRNWTPASKRRKKGEPASGRGEPVTGRGEPATGRGEPAPGREEPAPVSGRGEMRTPLMVLQNPSPVPR